MMVRTPGMRWAMDVSMFTMRALPTVEATGTPKAMLSIG
jgi:hypothetical protein